RRNQTDRPGGPGRSGGGWGTSRAGRVPGRERGDAGSPRQVESSPDPLNDTTKSRWRDLAVASHRRRVGAAGLGPPGWGRRVGAASRREQRYASTRIGFDGGDGGRQPPALLLRAAHLIVAGEVAGSRGRRAAGDLAAALDLATPCAGRDLPILDERLEPLEVALHAALDQ